MNGPVNKSNYGSTRDWADVFGGGLSGAQSGMQGMSQFANSKREAKEAKRRTLAHLLGSSMKRNRGMYEANQNYGNEISDQRANILQQLARGFVESLQGFTGG